MSEIILESTLDGKFITPYVVNGRTLKVHKGERFECKEHPDGHMTAEDMEHHFVNVRKWCKRVQSTEEE